MKIESLHLLLMRNDEHFQFHTEVRDLIAACEAGMLNIETLYETYLACYAGEDEALKKIVKSSITEDIEEADRRRDNTFCGLAESAKAALKHYDPEVVAAAKRLKVVFDTYGNVARKPLNEETSAVYNLLQDLNSACINDVEKLNLSGWVERLQSDNFVFDSLVKARNNEAAAKTQLRVKQTRAATDSAYSAIAGRINALTVVNGEEQYSDFVRKLNLFIEKYNNTIAQRAGRRASHSPSKGGEQEAV